MKYISTRGGAEPQEFCDILLGGLAPDGGLYLPEAYPQVADRLDEWRGLSYAELAFRVLGLFITDIPPADLKAICDKTYTAQTYRWSRDPAKAQDIVPLTTLEADFHLLELSNGPTLAFKDMAMQLLGNLFEYVLDRRNETINILGATSGDTGSAAEYAMRGKHGVKVFMLSPEGKMSSFQRAQMYSLQDDNIFNIAVRGMFDDAQDIVKAVSNDAGFKAKYKIGAVNSGNFGNICAGHIARMMGLPISRLVLATNENDVLDEFFRSGVYRPRATAETHVTSSPSMDISKASNFERFVFDLVGRDATMVRELWREVDAGGSFSLAGGPYAARLPGYGIVSGSSSHADRLATIRDVWQRYGQMIDTHTADGVKVAREHGLAGVPMIVLETAQAVKFAETIQEALGRDPARPAELEGIEDLPQRVEVVDAAVDQVKQLIVRHC